MRRNYINKEDFLMQVLASQSGQATEEFGRMILKLIDRIIVYKRFFGYDTLLKEEMRGRATLDCIKGLKKFNPEKNKNAFGYFSTIIFNAFFQVLIRHYKIKGAIDELINQKIIDYKSMGFEILEGESDYELFREN